MRPCHTQQSCDPTHRSAKPDQHPSRPLISAPADRAHPHPPPQTVLGLLSPPLTPFPKTRSEHVDLDPYRHCSQTTNSEAARRMMPSSSPPSSPPTQPHPSLPRLSSTEFTFRLSPRPRVPLHFPPQTPPVAPSWKRVRAVADVDGEHSSLHKKKRRLRLFLITSRLSPQFSHPATNIVDRGSSRIAVWAKHRALGRNILRKAAILNRIRRLTIHTLETAGGPSHVVVEQHKEQEQFQLARLTLMYGSHDSATRPMNRNHASDVVGTGWDKHTKSSVPLPAGPMDSSPPARADCDAEDASEYRSPNDAYAYSHAHPRTLRPSHLPLPPSPLGLSNYDALDLEDDILDPYAHLDEECDTMEHFENVSACTGPVSSPPNFAELHASSIANEQGWVGCSMTKLEGERRREEAIS